MAINARVLRQAEYRHAQYYLNQLQIVSDLYKQGGNQIQSALSKLETDWFQIQKGHSWAVDKMSDDDDNALVLCNSFPEIGDELLERRQTLDDRIHWLVVIS